MEDLLEKAVRLVCVSWLLVAVGCGEAVRRYTQMFYSGETEQLREKFSEEMKAEFPPGRP